MACTVPYAFSIIPQTTVLGKGLDFDSISKLPCDGGGAIECDALHLD